MHPHLRLWLPGLLLALLGLARSWLEATMARHMVLELPALFACGWLAAHACGLRLREALTVLGMGAVPAMLLALLVTGYWMLPVALDNAVLHPLVNLCKVASLVIAGGVMAAFWREAGLVLQGFFTLNWAWMTLTAGLLYQEAPQQLCSVYLGEQQSVAGMGMMALAAVVLVGWLWHVAVAAGCTTGPGVNGDGRVGETHA